ncbi:MAG: cell division protein FtsA [Proteobacteria bacterium]|nr:cell division protein FtsA [Pseudomonadota bacterium]MBU1738413.1 cell division protein FtsA [Pseudomonadota bacterium]
MLTRHIIITSLDIGSTNTTAVIAGVDGHGQVELLGHGCCPTVGYSDDTITDVMELGAMIGRCVGAAEEMAEMNSGSLVASVGGEHVRIMQGRGGIPLHQAGDGHKGVLVNRQDLKKALENAGTIPLPSALQSIHVLPLVYYVDGQKVKDPVGLSGTRIDVDVMIVAAKQSFLRSVMKAAETGGYRIRKFCYRPLATSRAVLSEDEMDQGACMFDIGGRHTDVALFKDGRLLSTSTLMLGGEDFTADTIVHLEVNRDEAENIKFRYGNCETENCDQGEFQIARPTSDGSLWKSVRRKDLGRVVMQPRAEEILEESMFALGLGSAANIMPVCGVLTGGGSKLAGLRGLAIKMLPFPVIADELIGVDTLEGTAPGAEHATALGLALFDMEQRLNRREEVKDNPVSRMFNRVLKKIHTVM